MLSVAPCGGSCIDASLTRAGSRPGRRPSFVSAKGPKTIDSCSADEVGRTPEGARTNSPGPVLSEAEGLRQGPPDHKSVRPRDPTAGVGWEGVIGVRNLY